MLRIHLEVTDSFSLKDKRRVVKSLKDRIRRRFNVSVAEVADMDKWASCVLGVASVSQSARFIDASLNKIVDFIEKERSVLLLDAEMEIL